MKHTHTQNYLMALTKVMAMTMLSSEVIADSRLAPALVVLKDLELDILQSQDRTERTAGLSYITINRKLVCTAIANRGYCAASVFADLLTLKATSTLEQIDVVQKAIDHVHEVKCAKDLVVATMYQDVLQEWFSDFIGPAMSHHISLEGDQSDLPAGYELKVTPATIAAYDNAAKSGEIKIDQRIGKGTLVDIGVASLVNHANKRNDFLETGQAVVSSLAVVNSLVDFIIHLNTVTLSIQNSTVKSATGWYAFCLQNYLAAGRVEEFTMAIVSRVSTTRWSSDVAAYYNALTKYAAKLSDVNVAEMLHEMGNQLRAIALSKPQLMVESK